MPSQSENPIAVPKPKPPLWRRVRAWTVILSLYAVILGMAGLAVTLIRHSFRSGIALEDRLFLLSGTVALLVPPITLAWVYLRTRWTTGRWLTTNQERVQRLSQCSAQRSVARQAPPWSWVRFAANWANYSAMESSLPLWQRALGWSLLAVFATLMLSAIALSIIFMGAGFATIRSLGIVIVGCGALLLVIPGQVVWVCISRFRMTGSIRTTKEELQQMGAQSTEWQVREWQKPLRSKILTTAVVVAVLSAWWIRIGLHHSRHAHENWFNPGLWTLFAIYAIWIQFRKPKTS
jgi:hypothetical protein